MRVKIICTIGPISANESAISALFNAGMNVARLNGSHADLIWHKNTIKLLKNNLPHIPIIFDIPGRKIRTLSLEHEPSFEVGDLITLTTSSKNEKTKIPISSLDLHKKIKTKQQIYADDGTLKFEVQEINHNDIVCKALVKGTLKSRKGINVRNLNFDQKLISDNDKLMLDFVVANKIEMIGISFVESSEYIMSLRCYLNNADVKIVAKIENQKGLENLDKILPVVDVVMIDRGDLAVETCLESVAMNQKKIIAQARNKGVPVIVATEMLHSMINNEFPTKAEISDITNAILDGASAIMLSGETAVGPYGIKAVKLMKKVSAKVFDYKQITPDLAIKYDAKDNFFLTLKNLLDTLPLTKVVVISKTGYAAKRLSVLHPLQEILCVSNDINVVNLSNLLYGTTGIHYKGDFFKENTKHVDKVLEYLLELNYLSDEDYILVTFVSYPVKGKFANSLYLHCVKDLKQALLGKIDAKKRFTTIKG